MERRHDAGLRKEKTIASFFRSFYSSLLASGFDLLASWNPLAQFRFRRFPSPAQQGWGPLDPKAGIVVETTGSAASTSFCSYLKKHNESVRITGHWHMSFVLFWAFRNQKPTVFLWREFPGFLNSMSGRYEHWQLQRWTLALRWVILMMAAAMTSQRILRVSYSDIVESPADTIGKINAKFGTDFAVGDNELPRIKTQTREDHEKVIAELRREKR